MPSFTADGPLSTTSASPNSSFDRLPRKSNERTLSGVFAYTDGSPADGTSSDRRDPLKSIKSNNLYSLPNGINNGTARNGWEQSPSKAGSTHSVSSRSAQHPANTVQNSGMVDGSSKLSNVEYADSSEPNGVLRQPLESPDLERLNISDDPAHSYGEGSRHITTTNSADGPESGRLEDSTTSPDQRHRSPSLNRFSSPAGMSTGPQTSKATLSPPSVAEQPRLTHRHTLQVPKVSNTRTSRDFSFTGGPSEEALSTGRFSPTHGETPQRRRGSLSLIRRTTRPMHSDAHVDEIPQDEDALRWTEAIRQKRASKRKRKEEEDDDRVIVGTKVDQNHVNWVTAYNMLTGIRFTVSRTNAKMDRELTDADFTARHKFSFDITGNELTPSAKYDFKFKDYSPWVFRHLRSIFGLDPADYLMSLTSKYILSELGSPGKSGSFFYFSRDYKYIIKTIHHAEHKLLRKVLRDYYKHVVDNPNTLISQFYGLHRVKIPYGRKIHFVVMNNLFPPHRDIHQMFDLKGSTIGREFKEEGLEKNPRATLKDLNWLRRNLHLEFDLQMKDVFVEQMRRDVALLQRLHIMDYSLLVGVHDLGKGNEEKLRETTLRVFQPGGERDQHHDLNTNMLTRTPSRMENARKARQLRLTLKNERPVPMGMVQTKMPDELFDDERKDRIFSSDDGGVRATHEDGSPGEAIYYLGIIDCLTHYGMVKRLEHMWKGLSNDSTQISPIPPEGYGNRFVKFMTGVTMTKEESERFREEEVPPLQESEAGVHAQQRGDSHLSFDGTRTSRDSGGPRSPAVEKTLQKAQRQADRTSLERRRSSKEEPPDRTLGTFESAGADRNLGATLPIVEEAGEAGSTGGRSGKSGNSAQQADEKDEEQPDSSRPDPKKGTGGIRRVPRSANGPNGSFFPDIPRLVPTLSTSPAPMDAEKSVLGQAGFEPGPDVRYTH